MLIFIKILIFKLSAFNAYIKLLQDNNIKIKLNEWILSLICLGYSIFGLINITILHISNATRKHIILPTKFIQINHIVPTGWVWYRSAKIQTRPKTFPIPNPTQPIAGLWFDTNPSVSTAGSDLIVVIFYFLIWIIFHFLLMAGLISVTWSFFTVSAASCVIKTLSKKSTHLYSNI